MVIATHIHAVAAGEIPTRRAFQFLVETEIRHREHHRPQARQGIAVEDKLVVFQRLRHLRRVVGVASEQFGAEPVVGVRTAQYQRVDDAAREPHGLVLRLGCIGVQPQHRLAAHEQQGEGQEEKEGAEQKFLHHRCLELEIDKFHRRAAPLQHAKDEGVVNGVAHGAAAPRSACGQVERVFPAPREPFREQEAGG